jgi:predicted phage tail protein
MPAAKEGIELKMALNGRLFEGDDEWCLTFPSPGDSIVFTAVPQGGGDSGKDMLRMVALVAIAVVATYYAGPQAGAAMAKAGYGAFGVAVAKYAATAAVMVIGGVLVNAMIPPPNMDLGALGDGAGGLDSSATYSWYTAQNRINQGGALGVLYGTVRVTPQLIAKYTSLVDEDDTEQGQQYLNLLFGVADHYTDFIGDLIINNQSESSYSDIHTEPRRGLDNQSAIDWFGVTYSEVPISVALGRVFNDKRKIYNYEYLDFGDDYYGFETSGSCSSILIELNYPRGFGNYVEKDYYSGDEWRTRYELQGEGEGIWDVRYRVKGTSTWTYTTFTVKGRRNRRFRCSAIVEFGSTDIFEVGIKQQNMVIEGVTAQPYAARLEAVTSFIFSNPHVVHTTSTGIDRLVVSVVLPQGLYHLGDDGELEDVSVQINVDVRRVGSGSWDSQHKKITAATTSTLRRYYDYTFSSPGQFEIRVYYAAPPPRGLRNASQVVFDHIKEGLWEGFRYPGTSILALRALATEQLSGGLPRVSMLAQRNVLAVYDGNGVLDKPANNPAWVCWDILTNERYGGNIDFARILYSEFEQWASFCTVNGFEVNAYFDTTISFADALNKVSAIGRGTIVQKGTDFGVVIDQAGGATQLFTVANIVADSFKINYMGIEDRLNAIEVTYTDKDKGYIREVLEIRTHEFTSDDQVRKASLDLSFITDREQAAKHGEYLLKNNLYLRKTISFDAEVDAIACMVGDVIKVQHDVPYWGQGGRVVSATADTVTLDQEVTREPGKTYAILVRHQDDDSLEEQNIESVGLETTGDTLPLVGAWSKIPAEDAVYSFGERQEVTEEFRLLAVNRSGELRCTLECIEYNPAVYDHTWNVVVFEDDPVVFLVKNLRADEFWRNQDGGGVGVMVLTWDGDAILFHVWYRKENTAHWIRAGETSNNKFEIHFLDPGKTYDFCVSGTRNPDDGKTYRKQFRGWGNKIRVVWPVTNLEIVGQGNNTVWQDRDLKLRWALQVSNTQTAAGNEPIGAGSFPPTSHLAKYRVQVCNPDGSLRRELFTLQPEYTYTYEMNHEDTVSNALIIKVWAVDKYGHESFSPATISVSNPAPAAPSGLRAEPFMRAVTFNWSRNSEIDFDHYTYATKLNDDAWSDWEETPAPALTRPLSDAEITATGGQAIVYLKVRAHDTFGNVSGESTTFAETMVLTIESTDIEDFSITGSKMFAKIPILENDIWYADTPAAGQVSWNAHKLFYNGVEHSIAAGNTAVSADDDAIFIFWQLASPTTYQTSTTHPGDAGILGEHDFIIAVNVNGAYNLAWNSVANQVVGSAYIMKAAINDLHVNEVSASKIKATSIMTPGVYMGDALYGESGTGRVVTASVSAAGLYLTSSYLGFYDGADWNDSVYIKSDGKFKFRGDGNNYIEWDGADLTVVGNLSVQNPSSVRSDLNVENGATNNSSWEHTSDSTKIDGGKIYTNTITASEINGAGFGTLTISSGKIVLTSSNAIEVNSVSGILVYSGGSVRLRAEAGGGKIQFAKPDGTEIGFLTAFNSYVGGGWYSVFGYSLTLMHDSHRTDNYILIGGYGEQLPTSEKSWLKAQDESYLEAQKIISGYLCHARFRANYDSTTPYTAIEVYDRTHNDSVSLKLECASKAFYPDSDEVYDLGKSGNKWKSVWASDGSINTSDLRSKVNIERASLGLDFVRRVEPISFKWRDINQPLDPKLFENESRRITYKRKHYGFAAQQIEEVLSELGISTNDFAGLIHDKETDQYGTRSHELLPVLWRAVQELSEQINLLEEKINV